MTLDLPVYPPANLPATSSNWGRETQNRIIRLQRELAEIQGRLSVTNRADVSTYNKLAQQVQELQTALTDLAEVVDTQGDLVARQAELVSYDASTAESLNSQDQSGDVITLTEDLPNLSFVLDHDMLVRLTFTCQATVQGAASATAPQGVRLLAQVGMETNGIASRVSQLKLQQVTGSFNSVLQSSMLYTSVEYALRAGGYTVRIVYKQQGVSDIDNSVFVSFYGRNITAQVLRRANLAPLP